MSASKFKGLLDAARGVETDEETAAAEIPAGEPRKAGRPAGKHSNPAFRQVSVYLRRDTHRRAKMALLEEGADREFSELVEELVAGWLRTRADE